MSRKLSQSVDDEFDDIVKRYEQFLNGNGSGYFDVEELESIVDYYLRKGRTKDSSNAIEFGLQLHPASASLKTKRAKLYLVAGDVQKAFRILESIADSGDYEVTLLRIETLLRLGRIKEAGMFTYEIFERETEDIDNICLDLSFIYIAQLDFETALRLLKKAEIFNPKNTDVLFELAFCYEQLTLTNKAIETYNRILNADSYMSEAWFNLGQIYFGLQDFNNAVNAYDYAVAINESDSLSWLQKGHSHFQLSEFEKAIAAYIEYEKITLEPEQAHLFIGECYEKLEKFDMALEYYNKAKEKLTDNYDVLTGIGICLLELERFTESLTYIRQAISVQEDAPDAWIYLAEAFIGMDDTQNALLAYLKSIGLDPNQPDALMAIANICMDNGEYKTALQYYLTAFELDNTLEYIEIFIAVAYFKNNNYEMSKIFLKKASYSNLDALKLFFEICPEAVEIDSFML